MAYQSSFSFPMRNLIKLAVAFLSTMFVIPPLLAQDSETKPHGPAPGLEWTTMQDINPNAPGKNRPIKQKWAVVIGLSNFQEQRLASDDLPMSKAAREFYDYLVDPKGGRFAKEHVRLLLNHSATRNNIISSLGEKWLGTLAGPDDLVVVFIATEAFPMIEGGAYLAAYDCALNNVYQTCLSMEDLMGTLKKNVKSDRIVLVLESKYSGAAQLESGAKALFHGYNIDLEKILLGKGNIILSSSRPNEETWGNDFSNSLVAALRENDGLIPLGEAFAKAKQATEYKTAHFSRGGKRQTPVMKSNWTGNDLVIGTPPIEQVSDIPQNVNSFLSAEGHYLKANQAVVAGDLDKAIEEYKQALAKDPTYADVLSDYGTVMGYRGNWQEAKDLFKRACQAKPNDSLFRYNYARSLQKLGMTEAYVAELKTAYRLNPKDKDVLLALSDASRRQGDETGAIRYLQEALKLYPASAELHNSLSVALFNAGALTEAIDHARQAVQLNPKLTAAHINLGSTLLSEGDAKSAADAYREAVSVAPADPEAHYGLSKALEQVGDIPGARNELSKFLELCKPTDSRLESAKKHLSELKR
ncbi:MAG TPA: tetratricopeptide repeat protein [Candidatus Obscuribacterales bacterium]